MRRWLLAVAALFGAYGVSNAQYVIIKYNLAPTQEAGAAGPGGGGEGVPGGGLSGPRAPSGGSGGSGGMRGGLGGPMSPAGGGSGSGSGMRGPGGQGGFGQGFPGGGSFPPGGGSFQPGGGSAAGGAPAEEDVQITPHYIIAVVEVKNVLKPINFQYAEKLGQPLYIQHKWGRTALKRADNLTFFPMMQSSSQMWVSALKSYEKKYQEAHPRGDKAAARDLIDLGDLALSRGFMPEFHKVMEELVQNYPTDPVAAGYQKVKAELERPAAANPNLDAWKQLLGMDAYKSANLKDNKGHYTLIHDLPSGDAAEAQSRLTRLENAFQSFYYWFALRGHAQSIKVPQHRLLAVLTSNADRDSFSRLHKVFGDQPLAADGFYARRDNLLVLSPQPLDSSYQDLRSVANGAFKGEKDPSQLLNGRGTDYDGQALALLLKVLEEDGEVITAGHETARQLLAAGGLLPRNVEIPQWIQFGMGSFFETPRGSPWPTLGQPSSSLIDTENYLYTYRTWRDAKKLDAPKAALEKVITDHYFQLAKDAKDPTARHRARTMSWALTYFLARAKFDGLLEYYRELGQLPRDLRFDDHVLMLTFARAFKLLDARDPTKVDAARFASFANEWDRYIKELPFDVKEVIVQVHKEKPKAPENNNPYGRGGGRGQ